MLSFLGLKVALYPPLPPCTVLRGIQHGVKIADLHGWTMFFCGPYSHKSKIEDFNPPGAVPGMALLVGARRAGSDTLALAAMGHAEIVTAVTTGNATRLHNGVWWYYRPGRSMGYAPNSSVIFGDDIVDKSHPDCPYRLSWRLDGFGGWRAGASLGLNWLSEWEKVIFVGQAQLEE